jgi:hypothetical protein
LPTGYAGGVGAKGSSGGGGGGGEEVFEARAALGYDHGYDAEEVFYLGPALDERYVNHCASRCRPSRRCSRWDGRSGLWQPRGSKGERVCEVAESKGCRPLFLTPYSSDLHPCLRRRSRRSQAVVLRRVGARIREAPVGAVAGVMAAVAARSTNAYLRRPRSMAS